MTDRLGCYWYVGVTQFGKTTKALRDLRADILATGWPALILDCMPAKNFLRLAHQESVSEVLLKLYHERTHACFTPKTRFVDGKPISATEQVNQIVRGIMARKGGGIIVLWDECSLQMDAKSITDDVAQFVRGWAHHGEGKGIILRLVTQRPGDIHGDCYSSNPEVYAFMTEKDGDLDRLKREFQFDPDKLKGQKVGEYLTKPRRA